jgi:hypothetical protein
MVRLHLPIANPCHEDWDGMTRDGARRFCQSCDKHVHDLSDMSEAEGMALLSRPRDRQLCVRYRAAADGTVLFRPESTPAPRPRAVVWLSAAASLAATLLTGCADTSRAPDAVFEDHCTYSVGPWSFSVARGEGGCPAESVDEVVMGAEPIVVEPQIPDEPRPQVVGEAPIEPIVDSPALLGRVAPPEPTHVKMGDIAAPEEPCDPPPPAEPPVAPRMGIPSEPAEDTQIERL